MDGMRKPKEAAPRERVLSDDEIRQLWTVLPSALPRSKTCQRIIKLCLLTGQRVGEVAGMRVAELDIQKHLWTLPGDRTKNKHAHSVPLSYTAVEIIEDAIADGGGSDFVFPNEAADGPFDVRAVAHTIRRAKDRIGLAAWTPHDLRRTAATGMARLGVSPIVIGNVLNHRTVSKAGVTLSVYAHYDYAKEKREALDLWADRIAAVVGEGATAEIVNLDGARA
jgi:integrase